MKMNRLMLALFIVLHVCSLSGCGQVQKGQQSLKSMQNQEDADMKLYFDETEIPVTWENCDAVHELMEEAVNGDITVSMSMYGGFEQVGPLGRSYAKDDEQIATECGDIVLYGGNQIVVFYGSNSWSYTKLGKMDLPEKDIEDLLSNGDITLTIRK